MAKIELKKLVLKTADGKNVDLTIPEARDLFEQLRDLFGAKETVVKEHHHYPWMNPIYTPTVTWLAQDNNDTPRETHIMCNAGSGLSVSYVGAELTDATP